MIGPVGNVDRAGYDLDAQTGERHKMITLHCESVDCNREIGYGETLDDATEMAYDDGHHYDSEASVWTCSPCVTAQYEYWARELPVLAAEQSVRDQQTRDDDFLAAWDLTLDSLRDCAS